MVGHGPAHVVVVGGGITGLVAAWALRRRPEPPRVTLLEADDRLGGKILTTPFAGLPAVDAGPDAFLARVPWAVDLATELGLADELTSPASGRAYVWWDGDLHPIPAGLVLGVPTELASLARSRLLSWRGKARAALEPLLPRTHPPEDDLAATIRRRFGAEVYDRLVGPLVGSIYAGDPERLSRAGTAPQLDAVAGQRSLLLALRGHRPAPATDPASPVFLTPKGGLGRMVDVLELQLRGDPGVTVRTGAVATPLQPAGPGGWQVSVAGDAAPLEPGAVILAVPAFAAAELLGPIAPRTAGQAATIPYASVVLVTLAFAERDVTRTLDGSGYLVPPAAERHLTACSWASTKWAHWHRPGQVVLRASLGRFGDDRALHLDDDAVLAATLADLRDQLGVRGDPTDVRVTRWPRSFPQYLPGHPARARALAATLAEEAPGVVVAGAAYQGIGIPACIRQGRDAAALVGGSRSD